MWFALNEQIAEGKAQHFAHADYLLLLLKELHDLLVCVADKYVSCSFVLWDSKLKPIKHQNISLS